MEHQSGYDKNKSVVIPYSRFIGQIKMHGWIMLNTQLLKQQDGKQEHLPQHSNIHLQGTATALDVHIDYYCPLVFRGACAAWSALVNSHQRVQVKLDGVFRPLPR